VLLAALLLPLKLGCRRIAMIFCALSYLCERCASARGGPVYEGLREGWRMVWLLLDDDRA
jgi:hypothetical protein